MARHSIEFLSDDELRTQSFEYLRRSRFELEAEIASIERYRINLMKSAETPTRNRSLDNTYWAVVGKRHNLARVIAAMNYLMVDREFVLKLINRLVGCLESFDLDDVADSDILFALTTARTYLDSIGVKNAHTECTSTANHKYQSRSYCETA